MIQVRVPQAVEDLSGQVRRCGQKCTGVHVPAEQRERLSYGALFDVVEPLVRDRAVDHEDGGAGSDHRSVSVASLSASQGSR